MFDSNVFYYRLHSLGIIYNLDWDMTPLNTLFLLHGPTTKTSLTVGINIPLSVAAPHNLVACHHYSNVALGLVVDICCYCGGSVGGGHQVYSRVAIDSHPRRTDMVWHWRRHRIEIPQREAIEVFHKEKAIKRIK